MPNKCFVDVDSNIWLIKKDGTSNFPGDFDIDGDTVRILGAHDELDERGVSRLIEDEYVLWPSLRALAMALEPDEPTPITDAKEQDIFAQIQNQPPVEAIVQVTDYGDERRDEIVFMSADKNLTASVMDLLSKSSIQDYVYYERVPYSGGLLNLNDCQKNPDVFLEYVKQEASREIMRFFPWVFDNSDDPIDLTLSTFARQAENNGYSFGQNPEIAIGVRAIVEDACKKGVSLADHDMDFEAKNFADGHSDINKTKIVMLQSNIKLNNLQQLEELIEQYSNARQSNKKGCQ